MRPLSEAASILHKEYFALGGLVAKVAASHRTLLIPLSDYHGSAEYLWDVGTKLALLIERLTVS
jgi:hypothetical protein